MKRKIVSMLLSVFAIPACTAYQPQPLSKNHPAHADAATARRVAPSLTLAHTREEITSPMPAITAALAEKDIGRSGTPKAETGQTVTAEGKVVATLPGAGQLVVEHGAIQGFMDAMTMGYRVEPPSLIEGFKFGDKVRFTIDVANKAIIKLDRIN